MERRWILIPPFDDLLSDNPGLMHPRSQPENRLRRFATGKSDCLQQWGSCHGCPFSVFTPSANACEEVCFQEYPRVYLPLSISKSHFSIVPVQTGIRRDPCLEGRLTSLLGYIARTDPDPNRALVKMRLYPAGVPDGHDVPVILILVHVSKMNISLYAVDNCFQLIANFGSNLLQRRIFDGLHGSQRVDGRDLNLPV